MNSKIQTFAQLATNTSGQLTGSYAEWTHFLETAARLYKDICYKRWKSDFTQQQQSGWLVCGAS